MIAYGFIRHRYSLTAIDLKDFFVNRFLRIYPIFLTLTFFGWITETLQTGTNPLELTDIPAQIFAFQFDQDYRLNGVFWTLGVELHFYLLAPLLVVPFLQSRRIWNFWAPLSLYAAIILWSIFAAKKLGWSFDGRNIVACLPHFLTGMAGCRMVMPLRQNRSRFLQALVGVAILIICTNQLYHFAPKYFWSPVGIMLTDAAILLLVVAHASWPGRHTLPTAALMMLGTLSYGLYAWHGYWMIAMPALREETLFLVIVSLLSAYLSYRCIESPALKLRRVHVAKSLEAQ